MTDCEILQRVLQAFADCQRPEHFTNHMHCEECAANDALRLARDIDTLQLEDVPPGADPICGISPEGFAYYFPALARLTLSEPHPVFGWYGSQLIFHLCYDGHNNKHVLFCTPEQRRVVVELLHHIIETRTNLVDNKFDTDWLFQAIEIWSDETPMNN